MKKVLIYHKRSSTSLGGDCFILLKFIAELQKSCEVTLALDFDFGLAHAAEIFDVPIDLSGMKIVTIDPGNGFLSGCDLIKSFHRIRRLKKLAEDADVCISTVNVFDFGKPGHQFVCILSSLEGKAFYDYVMKVRTKTGLRRLARKFSTLIEENVVKPLLGIRPTRRIIRDPREHIYPTSHYVEGIMRGYFGSFNSRVFYPPTTFELDAAPVERDPLQVTYIGRIFAPKRLTDIIAVVESARALTQRDLKLSIAGELQQDRYSELLKKLAEERPWLRLVGPKYGKDKERFLLSGTYAIQAEKDETFGICITEYLKAGMVVLVPNDGGPKEIVDDPELTFDTNEAAARILARLVSDEAFRAEKLRHCAERAADFTPQAYMARQHRLLEHIVNPAESER